MDLDYESEYQPREIKRRRKRNMTGERNFHCGCGRSYLSYPALYTHVKNKHEGIFPKNTVIHKKNGRRGRQVFRRDDVKEKKTLS